MSNFILQFPLKTQKWQEDVLDKRFNIARMIYNSLVNISLKRYHEMIKTTKYRELNSEITKLYKNKKANQKKIKIVGKELNNLRKEYKLTEYDFQKDVKEMQHHFKTNIDSFTAQKIATRLWAAYDDLFFGDGKFIHYKKYGNIFSVEGKSNSTGIRFFKDKRLLVWNKLEIPVSIKGNDYELEALENKISYCRIVRKFIKNKYKYYIQIVFDGIPPKKHKLGKGNVGIDIGTSTIAYVSKDKVYLDELANKVQNVDNEIAKLQRKQDRSRRATNPSDFKADGTINKKDDEKLVWIKSNHYIKTQSKLRELFRKQADIRKYLHECLSNEILEQGDNIYVEEMNFKGLQKRSKKTSKNKKGRFKRKKRFGKSIANRAPAMLLTIIDRKLKYHNKELIKIQTAKAKASQYNHIDNTYKKKSLGTRWNDFGDFKIQRDLYSAFLIMNSNDTLDGFDLDKCNNTFNNFVVKHNIEIDRLKNSDIKRVKSLGL